jgi:hypothetical protein
MNFCTHIHNDLPFIPIQYFHVNLTSSPEFTSFYLILLHFTSIHSTSLHSTTPPLRLILILFLKLLGLQERVSKLLIAIGDSLQRPCYHKAIGPIAFQALSPVYSRVHMRAVFLRYAKISQFESSLRFGNLAALAPGLTHLSFTPYRDPSTPPHIQESDTLVMCRLNFSVTVSLFKNTHCKMKFSPGFFNRVINLISPT